MTVSEESRAFAERIGRDAGKEGISAAEFWRMIENAGFTPQIATDRGILITSGRLRRIGDTYIHRDFVTTTRRRQEKPVGEVAKPTAIHSPKPLVLTLDNGDVTISSERIEAHFRKVKQVTIEFE